MAVSLGYKKTSNFNSIDKTLKSRLPENEFLQYYKSFKKQGKHESSRI